MNKKPASVKIALEKAAVYKKRPLIPNNLASQFPQFTHCEIRSYYQYYITKINKGNPRAFRRFRGFVFIFLVDQDGNPSRKPIRVIHKGKMKEKAFLSYIKCLTENASPAFRKKTVH